MTLSPADLHDEYVDTLYHKPAKYFDSEALGLVKRQTLHHRRDLLKYCQRQHYEYTCLKDRSINFDLSVTKFPFVLHTKDTILLIGRKQGSNGCIIDIQSLVNYTFVLLHLKIQTTKEKTNNFSFFLKPRLKTHAGFRCLEKFTINIKALKPSHTPFTTNLTTLAEDVLDPGMSLWYTKLGHEQYLAVLQHNETRRLYCTTKGCHHSFASLRDWHDHYHLNFSTCGVFTKAMIVDNQVLPLQNCKLVPGDYPSHNCTYIQKKVAHHSYAWKSLGDLIYGKQLSNDLHMKLNRIK